MAQGIESSIGKLPMTGKPARTYVIDDPASPQVPPDEPRQMSPEEFNAYREQLSRMKSKQQDSGGVRFQGQPIDIPQSLLQTDNPEELRQVADQARKEREIISPAGKSRLEILLGLGRKTIVVDVEGHKISLKNLSSAEIKAVMKAVADVIGFDRIYAVKHMTLAYSIESVDGEPIDSILGGESSIELRADLIENMEASVVDTLYSAYTSSLLTTIKTEQEAKEVVEDLKKS